VKKSTKNVYLGNKTVNYRCFVTVFRFSKPQCLSHDAVITSSARSIFRRLRCDTFHPENIFWQHASAQRARSKIFAMTCVSSTWSAHDLPTTNLSQSAVDINGIFFSPWLLRRFHIAHVDEPTPRTISPTPHVSSTGLNARAIYILVLPSSRYRNGTASSWRTVSCESWIVWISSKGSRAGVACNGCPKEPLVMSKEQCIHYYIQ